MKQTRNSNESEPVGLESVFFYKEKTGVIGETTESKNIGGGV
jgi:hypothetical protein